MKGATWNQSLNRWEPPATGYPKRKQETPIRKRSKEGARLDRIYSQERRWFLALPENATCPIAASGLIPDLSGELRPHHRSATTIHHRKGRVGSLLLDKAFWLGASFEGHQFIHANPKIAYEKGWMLSR